MASLNFKVKLIGLNDFKKQVRQARKDLNNFYALGKKYGIKRPVLSKLLTFQIENANKPKLDLNELPKIVYK